MRHTWIAIALAATLVNCESGLEPTRTTAPSAASATPALRDHARSHLQAADALELALAHGRLIDARDAAAYLVRHPLSAELTRAAHAVERAPDVVAASAALGEVGAACSTCHVASGVTARFPVETAPPDATALEPQMHRQQWAALQLWHGLVGPDEAAWREGAEVLASMHIDARPTVDDRPDPEIFELAAQVPAVARRAVDAPTPDRAAVYGSLMKTCAGCHGLVRLHAVPETEAAPFVSASR